MSHNTHSQDELVLGAGDKTAQIGKIAPVAGLVGGVCTLLSIAAIFSGNGDAPGSYLFGWYFWLTITMGMFGITVLHHTVRGSWSLPWLRILESGGGWASLTLMAILFLPIVAKPDMVYSWVHPGTDHILLHKAPWLNQGFWTFRYVFYFAIWIWFAQFFMKSARKQEQTQDFKLEAGRSSWGAVGLLIFALTFSFAAFDWGMSLEPKWYSTMYGVWQMIGSALGASAFTVVLLCNNAKKAPYTEVVTPNVTKDWGNILFMFTMVWAYTSISQFLIIWNGNLPETTSYFVRRSHFYWNAVGMATIVGQFFVPWMTLLSPRIKRYPHLLRGIAGWIFCVHIIDVYQVIQPSIAVGHEGYRAPFGAHLALDILSLIGVGGLWLFIFSTQIRKAALLPAYDNRLQEALKHAH